MKKEIPIFIISLVVVSGVSLFIGTKISNSKSAPNFRSGMPSGFGNNQYGLQQGSGIVSNRLMGQNMVNGDILSKDDSGITIKLRDGGSKIIFVSNTTTVYKSVEGTKDDLIVGESVVVNGKTNTDGSISATSIDLRTKMVNTGYGAINTPLESAPVDSSIK